MFHKEKSCHHGIILGTAITVLLALILIVLVFKTGMMLGSKSGYSTCKYSKGHSELMQKKSAYNSYKVVTELTDSGFVVKGIKGDMLTVVVNEDTKIIKGDEAGEVSEGDKVYVTGELDEAGQLKASLVKIYDMDVKKLK